jgi:V8-like Glu-specific endopeptidase
MLLRALLLSLLAITLSSCANEAKEESKPASGAYTIPVETLAEGQKIAQEAVLECGTDCSPSVGLLAYATPEHAGQCSAFLVGDDIVATNSHCIPDDLKEAGSSCKNRLWMHFAKDGSKETSIACDQVIFDSKNNKGFTDKPDYAYIKLAKASTRPSLRITRDGFPEGAQVYIQKVNPVKGAGRMKGKQERVECRTVQNSNSLLSFFHPYSPTAFITECLVIKGNSGSPVLAKDGSVRGVVFAFQDPNDVKEVVAKNKNLKLKEGLSRLNFAANFACLRGPDGSEADRIPACADHAKNFREHQIKRAVADAAALTATIESQMAGNPALADFEWTSRFEKANLQVSIAYAGVEASPVPKCVKPGAAAKYASEVAVDLPNWAIGEEYDRYVRGTTVLGAPAMVKAKIKVYSVGANEFTVLLSGKDFVHKIENLALCE